MTRLGRTLAIALTMAACAHDRPRPVPAPPPQLPDSSRGRRAPSTPAEWYWDPADVERDGAGARKIERPVPVDAITRWEGAARLFGDLGAEGRERLRRDGIVVLGDAPGSVPRWQMGAFYKEWADARVPCVVTLDALFALVHHALGRAYAEIEERELSPLLDALLAKLDERLGAEQRGAGVELREGYRLARGIVEVARAATDRKYEPADELADVVREEKERIDAHAGVGKSPLLGVSIDYARFAVPAASAHPGAYRAATWLAAAPLALVARTEIRGGPVNVAGARADTRAAMLLARLADREVDPAIHGALARLSRVFAFMWGTPDDITPIELGDLGDGVGVDVAKASVIANVVAVDALRVRARAARSPSLWDGSGAPGAAGVSVRVLGSHAAIDAVALESFASATGALPQALEVAAWLGVPAAREALRETPIAKAEGFEAALAQVARTRPTSDAAQLHASIHGSLVDALLGWSSLEADGGAADRARLESVLASWSLVRHLGRAFAQPKPAPRAAPREAKADGAPLPVFVEPAPAVIGRLLGTVRQARRGLARLGRLPGGSPGDAVLAEAEDILKLAGHAAAHAAADDSLGADDRAALSAVPARLAALDAEGRTRLPYAAVIHADLADERAVVTAAGAVEPAVLLVREPGTPRIFVAVGAHLTHHEGVVSSGDAVGPASAFSAEIEAGRHARAAYTGAFRMAR